MQNYTDFPYGGDADGNLWSTLMDQSHCGAYDNYPASLYSIFNHNTLSQHFPVTTSTASPQPIGDYNRQNSLDSSLFQDLIDRRNWCLSNLRLTAKEAEALRQENVNLQVANSELNRQLSLLQQHKASASSLINYKNVNSVADCFGQMRIGEKGTRQAALQVENVNPVKKTEVERVMLPKSISVRSNGYLKAVQAGQGNAGRLRHVDRVKTASDTQKVYVKGGGKKEEEPLELEVYNQGMTKTELCNKWQQSGACPYGDHCQFAHGIEELRPVIRHPRYKTEVCRMVFAGDPCPYGHRCHFRHALTEEEKLMTKR